MQNANTIFLGWNYPRAGREKQAGELFGAAVQYFMNAQQQGDITSFEPVMLSLHGGDLNGFFIIRGEAGKLEEMRNSEEFFKLVTQLNVCVDGIGAIPGWNGEAVNEIMQNWSQFI